MCRAVASAHGSCRATGTGFWCSDPFTLSVRRCNGLRYTDAHFPKWRRKFHKLEDRIKQRLTGAAILVVLVVLVVPEMFHGQRNDAPARAGGSWAGPPTAHPIQR